MRIIADLIVFSCFFVVSCIMISSPDEFEFILGVINFILISNFFSLWILQYKNKFREWIYNTADKAEKFIENNKGEK